MRSGFVAVVGRPNVGKSAVINQMVGTKVSIVSDKPHTTRTQVRGVLHRSGAQVVFVDTPGLHRPRTPLGDRLNSTAASAAADVELTLVVIDAAARVGPGDRMVAERVSGDSICVVNKVDLVGRAAVLEQLASAASLGLGEYRVISALTGEGVDELSASIVDRMPEGPPYYPQDTVTDVPQAFWVAELVREQLLALMRDEVPHSLACRVTEWEPPRIRCEILVERDSQKGIVIGHKGSVLAKVSGAVRKQLSPGAQLELFVRVYPNWQRRPRALERLGY